MGLGGSSAVKCTPELKKEIDDAITNHAVTVFSATYCPYCTRVKGLLKQWQPYVVEVDQVKNGGAMGEYKSYLSEVTGASRITWPRVFIGGKCVGGCDDTTSLKNSGKLEQMISEAQENSSAKL